MQVITPKEFDISNLSATEPKKKNDRLQSAILYNNSTFMLQTEDGGRAPFGVKSFIGGDKTDYTLSISLDPNGELVQKLRQLDDYMLDFGIEHSKLLFKQKYSPAQKEVVRAMYTSCIKIAEEGDYPPRISLKIQKRSIDDPKPNLLFYSSGGADGKGIEEVEVESFDQLVKLIPNGSNVKALIVLRPWFVSGRFGITMSAKQLLVPKRSGGFPTTYAFNNGDGVTVSPVKVSASKVAAAIAASDEEDDVAEVDDKENTDVVSVEDSDAEEEEEEEEKPSKTVKKAAAPAPAPAAAAKAKKPVAPARK